MLSFIFTGHFRPWTVFQHSSASYHFPCRLQSKEGTVVIDMCQSGLEYIFRAGDVALGYGIIVLEFSGVVEKPKCKW